MASSYVCLLETEDPWLMFSCHPWLQFDNCHVSLPGATKWKYLLTSLPVSGILGLGWLVTLRMRDCDNSKVQAKSFTSESISEDAFDIWNIMCPETTAFNDSPSASTFIPFIFTSEGVTTEKMRIVVMEVIIKWILIVSLVWNYVSLNIALGGNQWA